MISNKMLEVAVDCGCFLGEGPVWDSRRKVLCWVDIVSGDIHEFNPDTKAITTINMQQMVGAIAICDDGSLLAALKNGLAIVDRETGKPELICHPEYLLTENRFNDGKCDPAGRFWIGSMGVDEQANAGSVYMMDSDHITRKIGGTTISNGMAWSPDHLFFYHIDTPTRKVDVYDFDKNAGTITNKRTAVTIEEKDGHPDGMTIDDEGMLWIAHWGGWQVSRWNPLTHEKLYTLSIPVANVTSCTFGGDNLTDLYITTAKKGNSAEELQQQPLAGNLFVWKNCSYRGMPAAEFKKEKM